MKNFWLIWAFWMVAWALTARGSLSDIDFIDIMLAALICVVMTKFCLWFFQKRWI